MNKKHKVTLISNAYNFFNVFMLNHIFELSKKYDLTICCNNASKLKKKVPKNVKLFNINYKRGISIFHDIFTFLLTLFFLLKNRPNISISFTPKIGFMVSIASFFSQTPNRIHWYTGQIWSTSKGFRRIFYKFTDKIINFLSHQVLIDSFAQRNFLIKEKIIIKNRSTVLHKGSVGGVDISRFKFNLKERIKLRKKYLIDNKTFVFLYLGRINKDKGIIELINAFKEIKHKNVLLIFVGQVEEQKIIHLFKKDNRILYFKFTNKPEFWFSAADILCLPSHREGFGTVVIEAASCGIPSLCSNVYGLKNAVLERKTGFFHKPGSKKDIKKKMLYILNNKKQVKKYGIAAKKRVIKEFEQGLVTKKFLKFINSNILQND